MQLLPMCPRGELTPTQRAALVSWHLASGEGLTLGQIRKLGRYGKTRNARYLITAVGNVVDLRCDDGETWAAHYGKKDAPPQSSRERAAFTAYLFATKGAVTNEELRKRFGVSRQAVLKLLDSLSCVLPIYLDTPPQAGIWKIITMKELD